MPICCIAAFTSAVFASLWVASALGGTGRAGSSDGPAADGNGPRLCGRIASTNPPMSICCIVAATSAVATSVVTGDGRSCPLGPSMVVVVVVGDDSDVARAAASSCRSRPSSWALAAMLGRCAASPCQQAAMRPARGS